MLYLLQLVQALKFEPTPPPNSPSASSLLSPSSSLRHSHSHSHAHPRHSTHLRASQAAEQNLPTLEDFLVERSARNPVLGNHFFWYIRVEREDKARGRMFDEVARKFEKRMREVSSLGVSEHSSACLTASLLPPHSRLNSCSQGANPIASMHCDDKAN